MKLQLISEMDSSRPYYDSCVEVSKQISSILSSRFNNSKLQKSLDGTLYLYVFYNYPDKCDDIFSTCKESVYIAGDSSLETEILVSSFFTTSTIAIKNEVTVPENITAIHLYYSLVPVDVKKILEPVSDKKTIFTAVDPKYTFDDLIINEDERRSIFRAITIIKEKELVFKEWGYEKIDPSTKSILCFHGEPGTGKTMCAHAVASYLGRKILIARYSQIQSKYTGEGEQNLRKYFETAEKENAVLFIDEADTFLSKRLSSSNANSKIYNSMSNELYQLIEDFNGCIIFASNHITDFDPAVISRIIEPVEFKLPDKDTRKRIIQKLLPPGIPLVEELCDKDLYALADISDGFSGRDIRKSMLVFIADKLYQEKFLKSVGNQDIKVSLEDISVGFKEVSSAKKKLDEAVKDTNKKVGDFLAQEARNKRLLEFAALSLWADGTIHPKEEDIFNQLMKQYGQTLAIKDKSKLPELHELCHNVETREEKVHIIDTVARMLSIDLYYSKEEQSFVENLLEGLGYSLNCIGNIHQYIDLLILENKSLEEISSIMPYSEKDILKELQIEYSVPASMYQMSRLFLDGSCKFGGVDKNEEKAEYYLNKAKELGYNI